MIPHHSRKIPADHGVVLREDLDRRDHRANAEARREHNDINLEEQAELEREQDVAIFADPTFPELTDRPPVFRSPGARLGRPLSPPPFQFIGYLPNKGREFIDLVKTPMLRALADHTLQMPNRITTLNGIILRRGAKTQFVHSDQMSMPFFTPRPALFNFIMALAPIREEMGRRASRPARMSILTDFRMPYVPELRRGGAKLAVPFGEVEEW